MLAQPKRGAAGLQPGKLAGLKGETVMAHRLQHQRAGVAQLYPVLDHLPFLVPIQDRHQDPVPQQQADQQYGVH